MPVARSNYLAADSPIAPLVSSQRDRFPVFQPDRLHPVHVGSPQPSARRAAQVISATIAGHNAAAVRDRPAVQSNIPLAPHLKCPFLATPTEGHADLVRCSADESDPLGPGVPGLRDVHVARRVHCDPGRKGELGLGGRSAVPSRPRSPVPASVVIVPDASMRRKSPDCTTYTLPAASAATPEGKLSWASAAGPPSPANPPLPGARQRRDRTRRVDAAHAMVPGLRNVHVARRVRRDPGRRVELGLGRRPAVPCEPPLPGARQRRDRTRRVDAAHAMVPGLHDVHAARRVRRDPERRVELGLGRRPAVPCEPPLPGARQRRDRTRRVDAAHAMVPAVRDVHVARRVRRDPGRRVESCLRSRSVAKRVAPQSCPRKCLDPACGVHPAYAVIQAVSDVQVTRAIHGHILGESSRASVAGPPSPE